MIISCKFEPLKQIVEQIVKISLQVGWQPGLFGERFGPFVRHEVLLKCIACWFTVLLSRMWIDRSGGY